MLINVASPVCTVLFRYRFDGDAELTNGLRNKNSSAKLKKFKARGAKTFDKVNVRCASSDMTVK